MSIAKAEHDELCCVYAGLLLHDGKSEITAEKINNIIKASGNEVDAYYPEFFAKYLSEANIDQLLTASPAASSAPAEAPKKEEEEKKDDKKGKDKGKEKPKEKPKPKVEEEEDDGGFMDMFG